MLAHRILDVGFVEFVDTIDKYNGDELYHMRDSDLGEERTELPSGPTKLV